MHYSRNSMFAGGALNELLAVRPQCGFENCKIKKNPPYSRPRRSDNDGCLHSVRMLDKRSESNASA